MSYKKDIMYSIFFASLIFLLISGCGRKNAYQQEPISLYVDAVQFREVNENQKAIETLNTAVQQDEDFSLAHSLLGDIYQEMEDYLNSATSYKNASQTNPWSFHDHFNLGKVYYVMEQFPQAADAYVKAVEIKPNHLGANMGAAKSYYKVPDYNSAWVYGRRAEKIDTNVSEVQKLLGDIYEAQKDYEQAIASYKRSLEIDSDNPDIIIALEYSLSIPRILLSSA
ncbi:MAG: tetratricopeptide repeat protein [Planctomycetota bacterium]|jgi:tetratricopeptide (TPR) repeat protein